MTAIANLPPALWLLAAAILLPVLPGRGRAIATIAIPLIALGWLSQMEPGLPVTVLSLDSNWSCSRWID
jgi:hypothetical protein